MNLMAMFTKKERAEIERLNSLMAQHLVLLTAILKKNGGRITVKEVELQNAAKSRGRINVVKEKFGIVYQFVEEK